MQTFRSWWVALLMPLLLFGSSSALALAVSPTSMTLAIGAKSIATASGTSGKMAVSSTNRTVATATYAKDKKLVTVTAVGAGSATINLKDGSGTASIGVTVQAMSVSPTSVNTPVGASTLLVVSYAAGAVTASSANPAVATVSYGSGKATVVAKEVGSTTVTLKDAYTTVKIPVSVAAMSVSPASASLAVGKTTILTVSNAGGTVTTSSSNNAVVTASYASGKVTLTGKTAGTANVAVSDGHTKVVVPVTVTSSTGSDVLPGTYTLLAWNDLGMHCMDGDFSVSAILPPFNTLHAQLIDKASGKLVTAGVTLTYEAMADADNSINTISSTKTNFWRYAPAYFDLPGGLPDDMGLTGNPAPGAIPAPLSFEAGAGLFQAAGIPITPYDDNGNKNFYPMVKVVARDASGNALAQARVVLPVSDEMNCALCHASQSKAWDGTDSKARPMSGWVSATAVTGDARAIERDYKYNILRLHDDKHLRNLSDPNRTNYVNALKAMGFSANGLEASASGGKPVLCAACHSSNALGTTGTANTKPLTAAMHSLHGMVKDAKSGKLLDDITNRDSCYQCHPGSQTKCLRGVMGTATLVDGSQAMQCQSCHGSMSNVGSSTRTGWLSQPNCQACHHDGKRELSAVSSTGILKQWLDTRFATNPNTPAAGFSLYRFSKGHGNLQCEACHGSTHAEYPSDHRNDNVLSQDVQGFAGTISECGSCHKTVPLTATGGPHGMHTVGSAWVKGHENAAKNGAAACAYCHGADYRGSPLSTAKKARTFSAEGKTVSYTPGQKVGCYDCHNGPKGD